MYQHVLFITERSRVSLAPVPFNFTILNSVTLSMRVKDLIEISGGFRGGGLRRVINFSN